MDTGLVCYFVGWSSGQVAMNGAMSGSLFETFVISEVIKSYYNAGHDTKNLYFYRDKDKKEIDLLIEKDNVLYPMEIKKSARPTLDMTKSFSVLLSFLMISISLFKLTDKCICIAAMSQLAILTGFLSINADRNINRFF